MHEIAFQADKRFAEWSVCADCSSLFLFHEGILFVITFTRRIYSTSSHVFLPDSSALPFAGGGGGVKLSRDIHSSCLSSLDYCLFRLDYVELATI